MNDLRAYTRLLWQRVVRYALLDLLAAFVITGALYFVVKVVSALVPLGNPYKDYAAQSVWLLGLIYVASIVVTSAYWHFGLLSLLIKNKSERGTPPEEQGAQPVRADNGGGKPGC